MNIINHLSLLESAGLLSLAQVSPELEYLFRHTLVQEAAYSSLLEEDASRLHQLVGEALESLYPEKLDELAPVLGKHFEQAGDYPKAASYFERAGKKALQTYSHQEAATHFRNALRLTKEKQRQADQLAGLGEALAQMGHVEEAVQTWLEGIAHYQQLGDLENVAYLYARAGRSAWYFDTRLALELCQKGMELTQDAPESQGLALLHHETARAYYFNGKYDEALSLCNQALAMAERTGAIHVQAESLTTLGILPQLSPEERMEKLKKAVDLAESAGMLHVASRAHLNLGSALVHQLGDYRKAQEHYRRAADLARRCGAVQSELFYLTAVIDMSLATGELSEAEGELQEIERLTAMLPDRNITHPDPKVYRAWLDAYRGEWETAIRVFREAADQAAKTNNIKHQVEYSIFLVNGMLELRRLGKPVNLNEAIPYLTAALEISQTDEMATALPVIQAVCGALEAQRGNFSEARKYLSEAKKNQKREDPFPKQSPIHVMALEIAFQEKNWAEAITVFEELKRDHRDLGVFDWASVLLTAAEAYLNRSEPDDLEEAQFLLQEAGAIYTKIQSPVYLERVEALVRAVHAQKRAQVAAQRQVVQELTLAGKLQSSFLPEEPPHLPGWEIVARLRPARQTTGDYYDFIPLPDGKLGIVIADVADKGIGAALFMASSRSLLRAYAAANVDAPERVLQQTNQRITQDTPGGLFITLFYGILDPQTAELTYCNAGHNPPILLAPNGDATQILKTGIPIGIFPDANWFTRKLTFTPGSFLILYTDGVTEIPGAEGELFGEARLLSTLQNVSQSTAASAEYLLRSVLDQVDAFRGEKTQTDDLTLVIIQRSPLQASPS